MPAEITDRAEKDLQRIMLVEDDAALRNVIGKHLRTRGFTVEERGEAEGDAAESVSRNGAYDLLITDLNLPGMSGTELTRMALAMQPLVPVVVITGDPEAARESRPFSHGRVTYLLKPFELDELDEAIRDAIGRFKLLRAATDVAQDGQRPWPGLSGHAVVPASWLRIVDEQSGAGAGHGERVSLIASAIANSLEDTFPAGLRNSLEMAALLHEVGRVMGVSPRPVDLACCTAQLLWEMKIDPKVVRAVRHMHERWDGAGGPDGLVGKETPMNSRILAAADLVDHRASAWVRAGVDPVEALDRAIECLEPLARDRFGPSVAAALKKALPEIRWTANLFAEAEHDSLEYEGAAEFDAV
jgi:response regulator RpfG family c-di-GMP phosphodiesterase